MNDEEVYQIMQTVQAYYPLGFGAYADSYVGKQRWIAILKEKTQRLMDEENTPWKQFVTALVSQFDPGSVTDMAYHQFPSYTVQVELAGGVESQGHKRYLIADVSLLGNFYTAFIDDRYLYGGYENFVGKIHFQFSVLYHKTGKDGTKEVQAICNLLAKFFPDHSFVQHKILFDMMVDGQTPYDLPVVRPQSYSVYDLLMSNVYHNAKMQVLF